MFESNVEILNQGRIRKVRVRRGTDPLPYDRAIDLWRRDEGFRSWFIALLAAPPWPAFRWETPPVTVESVGRDFEFVLLDSPGLAASTDPTAFAREFAADPDPDVLAFPNLGGDALLVVPRARGPASAYGHLAAFTREAPEPQNHALWRCVGDAMRARLGARPVWLSTAGGGIAWVHVRLDSRPKYYGYGPYREAG